LIVPGPASMDLAISLSKAAGLETVGVEFKKFPDGESYLRVVGDLRGRHAVIVNGLHPPQDEHIIQLALLADSTRGLEAREITAIIPYLAYARQDRRFLQGEPVSALTVIRMLAAAGVDRIITVNIHSPWILDHTPIPVINLDATGLLATYLLQAGYERPLVLSPGKKGGSMAEEAASVMEAPHDIIRSRRDPVTGEVVVETDAVVRDRDVAIVDDMISTGTTMVKSVQLVKRMGAKRVAVLCVHGLFLGNAAERIFEAGAELLFTTDTVPNPYAIGSVAGLIASRLSQT